MHDFLLSWGPIFSSYVPAAALVYAVARGTKEWDRWRREKRTTKLAEVAADVLGASLNLTDALHAAASPWFVGHLRDEPKETGVRSERQDKRIESERLGLALTERWTAMTPTIEAFQRAQAQAEIYLSDEINSMLDDLWQARAGLHATENVYVGTLRQGTHMQELFEGALGTAVQTQFAAIRARIRTTLRPLAQLERTSPHPKPSPSRPVHEPALARRR